MPTARVAVVGSGIAGLSAAYHIAKHGTVEVTLFEKVGPTIFDLLLAATVPAVSETKH